MAKRESPKNRANKRGMGEVLQDVAKRTKALFGKAPRSKFDKKSAPEAYKKR